MENVAHETEKAISGAIKIDEKEIQDHIDGLVRQSVEDTLNAAHQGGRGRSESSPASESALRNGDHPALSDQAELRGGGADRDVSGRRFCPAGGGHHGSAVG